MAARKPWVGGNWKCNGTRASIATLASDLNEANFQSTGIDVVIFPVSIHIDHTRKVLDDKFEVGIQDIGANTDGAFTGSVSSHIAADCGIKWVLAGHSERRTIFKETDEVAAAKTAAAVKNGLNVAFCIGETLEEREAGKTDEICARQLSAVIGQISDWNRVVIAYEPVWAIGTGKVATKEQAQDAHRKIRDFIRANVSPQVADVIRIVYGGSVNETNCAELGSQGDIDGFLVGGASLKPSFTKIIESMKL